MDGTESYEEEARGKIFDYVFLCGPDTFESISNATGIPRSYVAKFTDHEWFDKDAGIVGIARKRGT